MVLRVSVLQNNKDNVEPYCRSNIAGLDHKHPYRKPLCSKLRVFPPIYLVEVHQEMLHWRTCHKESFGLSEKLVATEEDVVGVFSMLNNETLR
jgi:hypothetical protein